MQQRLQNIKKIEYIEPRYLQNVVVVHSDKVYLSYWRNFIHWPIAGLAQVEVDEAVDNGSRITTVKLTARSACELEHDQRQLCWRVTTVTGEQYLIGLPEQPFPITIVSNDFPDSPTEKSGQQVTVTWKTPTSLLKIMD